MNRRPKLVNGKMMLQSQRQERKRGKDGTQGWRRNQIRGQDGGHSRNRIQERLRIYNVRRPQTSGLRTCRPQERIYMGGRAVFEHGIERRDGCIFRDPPSPG